MTIEKQLFGTLPGGKEVHKYILKNHHGMEVEIINYGAIITSIRVPDKNNEPGDVVLGFDTLEEYLGSHPYFGAMVGRVCNRVGNSRFELDGKTKGICEYCTLKENECKCLICNGVFCFNHTGSNLLPTGLLTTKN